MYISTITSYQNNLIKHILKLRNNRKCKNYNQFIIEGIREIQLAINNNIKIEKILYTKNISHNDKYHYIFQQIINKSYIKIEVTSNVFQKISYKKEFNGILIIANTPEKLKEQYLNSIKINPKTLFLIAENIEKPGNLGAMIRTAEASGCNALIITKNINIYNANIIKSSQGLLFELPIIFIEQINLKNFLIKNKIQIITAITSSKVSFWEKNYNQPTAVLIGNEKEGLTNFWLQSSQTNSVTIPESGKSNSLNANVAAAIILFEIKRQRHILQ